jgi:arabinosaccharide transport system substrate-binding protein
MNFPYGPAPLVILILALATGAWLVADSAPEPQRKPDLVFATFVKEHADAYRPAIARFEKQYGVKIQLEVVDQKALQDRLQSALEVGADVPDMAELMYGSMDIFTTGPLDNVQLIDLTDKIHDTGLDQRLVMNRLSRWSSRGHVFALPHDMHPIMLVYRRDLVEQMGIDVNKLTTWDEFVKVGREVVNRSRDSSGVVRHYMIDLPNDGNDILTLLILQRGGGLFDASGDVAFDSEPSVDVVCWYVKQIQGKDQISYPCGMGQGFYQALTDGLCLFYMCPDWRTMQLQSDLPSISGKLALMPLPAWEPGGCRTSTWGGTGLAFMRPCRNFDLAWKLAMYLYYDPDQLAPVYEATHILPPLKDAWTRPEYHQPSAFFSGIKLGEVYSALAPEVPKEYTSAYSTFAISKLSEAFTNVSEYYLAHGDEGLRDYARAELKQCADRVRVYMNRNVFLRNPPGAAPVAAAK